MKTMRMNNKITVSTYPRRLGEPLLSELLSNMFELLIKGRYEVGNVDDNAPGQVAQDEVKERSEAIIIGGNLYRQIWQWKCLKSCV